MEAHLTACRDQLADLCRHHGVVRLEVFGSAVDGTFDAQRSDYDFIALLRRPRSVNGAAFPRFQ